MQTFRLIVSSCLVLTAQASTAQAWGQPALTSPLYYLASAPEVKVGATQEGELTREDGQNFKDGSRLDVWVLRIEAGQAHALEVVSEAFDAYLSVYSPDGTLLAEVDDGPDSLDPSATIQPDRSGAHLVVVSGVGPDALGPYRVTARPLSAPATVELPPSGRLEASLDSTDPPDPEVGGGPARSFAFELDRSALVRLRASSDAFDTVLGLFDERGWRAENDDAGGTTDSELYVELEPGSYRVVVSSFAPDGSGDFTVAAEPYVPLD